MDCLLLGPRSPAQEPGQEPALDLSGETVVVYNPDFSQSRDLAEYYASKRGIPKERLIGLLSAAKQ